MTNERKKEWSTLRPHHQWALILVHESLGNVPMSKSPFRQKHGYRSLKDTAYWQIESRNIERLTEDLKANRVNIPPHLPGSGVFLRRNMRRIFRFLSLNNWARILEELKPEYFPLSQQEYKNLVDLSKLWNESITCTPMEREEKVATLVAFLVRSLSWKATGSTVVENAVVHLVTIENISLNVPRTMEILFTFLDPATPRKDRQEDTGFSEAEAGAVAALGFTMRIHNTLLNKKKPPHLKDRISSRQVMLNLVVGTGPAATHYKKLARTDTGLVVLDENSLKVLFLAPRYSEQFAQVLKNSIGLMRLNPYTTEKPVERIEMFFGREREINRVLDHPSVDFMIVGTRRIGKSSLLKNLERITKGRDRIPIFIDCSTEKDFEGLTKRITERINPRRAERITLASFPQMVRTNHSAKGLRYLLLLDEIDDHISLAEAASDWRFFNTIRSLGNDGYMQTVMTGFEKVYSSWQSQKSPLFNFVTAIHLSNLEERSARKLATSPMSELGVSYTDGMLENTLGDAGGHPSFLQFICSKLVEELDRADSTSIDQDILRNVRQERDYRAFILKPFQDDTMLAYLDKLLLLLFVKSTQDYTSIDKLTVSLHRYTSLYTVNLEQVDKSMRKLELSGLLRSKSAFREDGEEENVYFWSIPAFPVALVKEYPIDRMIHDLAHRVKKGI